MFESDPEPIPRVFPGFLSLEDKSRIKKFFLCAPSANLSASAVKKEKIATAEALKFAEFRREEKKSKSAVGWGELANPNTGVLAGDYVGVRTAHPNLRPSDTLQHDVFPVGRKSRKSWRTAPTGRNPYSPGQRPGKMRVNVQQALKGRHNLDGPLRGRRMRRTRSTPSPAAAAGGRGFPGPQSPGGWFR